MRNVGLEATYFSIEPTRDIPGAREKLEQAFGENIVSVTITNEGEVGVNANRALTPEEVRAKVAECGLKFTGRYKNTLGIA